MILRGNVFSKILGMDTGITIVVPNNLKTDSTYKVAYLLHGMYGNNGTWADYSMLPVYSATGNTIYVMPEVARSFYADMKYGFKYFSYITDELPSICKSVFNISSSREDTAIIGVSMGGYGALKCALSKPQQYGMCGAFSSACLFLKEHLDDQRENAANPEFIATYGEKLIQDFVLAFGTDLEWRLEDEILELAKRISTKETKPIIYATCGTEDFLRDYNTRFNEEMQKLDFDFTYEEWKGTHDFIFFDESLKKAIDKFGL